jgi:hypothetical protein
MDPGGFMTEFSDDQQRPKRSAGEKLVVDRRIVVAGLASFPAVAQAETAYSVRQFSVSYVRTPGRHNLYGIAIDLRKSGGFSASYVLHSVPFSDRDAKQDQPASPRYPRLVESTFDAKSKTSKASVIFESVRFSDEPAYRLELKIESVDAAAPTIQGVLTPLDMKGKLLGGDKITSSLADLGDALASITTLNFEMTDKRASMFIARVFGERLQIRSKEKARLLLGLVDAGASSGFGRLRTALKPTFVLEAAENNQDEFPFLAFAGSVEFRRLFVRQAPASRGEGAQLQAQFQEKEPVPSGKGRVDGDIWLGTSDKGIRWHGADGINGKSLKPFMINQGSKEAKNKTTIEILPDGQPTHIAFRQWGSADDTLAVLRAPLKVTLKAAALTVYRLALIVDPADD